MERKSDLDQLREQFPAWEFGTVWTTVATGPDRCRLWAKLDGILLTAWNRFELANGIRREEGSSVR